MAMVCGCDDAEAMEAWGDLNSNWLAGFLDMPHGPPTQDVFLRVFGALEPEAFSAVFRAWVALLQLRLEIRGKHVAIDGKTSRRSFDGASGKKAIHTLSAWMDDVGLVIGQRQTEEKSNEITAIPELVRVLDIRGATVTIDAMGCQTEIAKTIIEGEGNYLISAKENQPTLRYDIEKTFAEADDDRRRSCDELPRPAVEAFTHLDKGHGRVENRSIRLCRDLNWLTTAERWSGLAFVAEITRECTVLATGKTSVEKSYYIGSDKEATAEKTSTLIRAHWGVESKLHWVLDIAFRDDDARHRAHNTAKNLATLRHFALNIVRQDPQRKLGVANSPKRAGWDRSYLIKLLTNAEPA
jgi:predicted transposase YbfD/YdcC